MLLQITDCMPDNKLAARGALPQCDLGPRLRHGCRCIGFLSCCRYWSPAIADDSSYCQSQTLCSSSTGLMCCLVVLVSHMAAHWTDRRQGKYTAKYHTASDNRVWTDEGDWWLKPSPITSFWWKSTGKDQSLINHGIPIYSDTVIRQLVTRLYLYDLSGSTLQNCAPWAAQHFQGKI